MRKLSSRWGKTIEKTNILQEYPRPQLVRDSYYNLNGEWEYAICKIDTIDTYDGHILVPFSPETNLSGVEQIVMPDDFLHYKKVFVLPDNFCKDRVILHFGAVDQECIVFMNDMQVGTHKGGYSSFSFDITDTLKEGENILTLRVIDKTEHSPHARGKQKLVKKGKYGSLFYTPNSGIWQTVWIESVAKDYIQHLKITPQFDASSIDITVKTEHTGIATVRVLNQGTTIIEQTIQTNQLETIAIADCIPWTPEHPHLYDMEIIYGEDRVTSYFGMRKFSYQKDNKGILRFFLNNEPYFFNGLLDQGYWPESLLTPPSDEALAYDIIQLKELGFNTIRKHVKVESDRFYYHCDKIGMIVWQDMPNGGGEYNMIFVTYLPNAFNWFARGIKDNLYSMFKRKDREGQKQYYDDLENMVTSLYNHPSIAVWVPFNEGWGQFDATKATEKIRQLDNTRLINEACGWFDQKGGDMYSIHSYVGELKIIPQSDRIVALTEFGGYAYPVAGHTACEKSFGYQYYQTPKELTESYRALIEKDVIANLEKGLSAAIYTQTSDIEEEINGLMTYDREVDKLDADVVKELNQKLYQEFERLTKNL